VIYDGHFTKQESAQFDSCPNNMIKFNICSFALDIPKTDA